MLVNQQEGDLALASIAHGQRAVTALRSGDALAVGAVIALFLPHPFPASHFV
jgi:hypothetical protein